MEPAWSTPTTLSPFRSLAFPFFSSGCSSSANLHLLPWWSRTPPQNESNPWRTRSSCVFTASLVFLRHLTFTKFTFLEDFVCVCELFKGVRQLSVPKIHGFFYAEVVLEFLWIERGGLGIVLYFDGGIIMIFDDVEAVELGTGQIVVDEGGLF